MESTKKTESTSEVVLTEEQVQSLLRERAQLLAIVERQEHDKAQLKKIVQAKIDALIPPDLLEALADLDKEFDTSALLEGIETLDQRIADAVVGIGHSVKAEDAGQAVYYKGKVTWDAKKREGLMVLIPQLEQVRSVGKPYVTIRR